MIIGIDIGGSKLAAALIDNGRVVELDQIPSPVHGDLQQLLPTLLELIDKWLPQARGIGIGCTGLVSNEEVLFLSAGPDKRLALKPLLQQASGLPVLVLNDAWAAAWGEYRCGQHPGETLVYITVSTGIGGGIVQNGHLVTAPHGFAAHLGHLTVSPPQGEQIRCHCGRRNCVEAIASGTAIAQRATALLGRDISCREVFQRSGQNPALQALIEGAASAVAELLANLRALTGTDHIVLGGSVGLNPLFRALLGRAIADLPEIYHLALREPFLGQQADLIGAARALQEQLETV